MRGLYLGSAATFPAGRCTACRAARRRARRSRTGVSAAGLMEYCQEHGPTVRRLVRPPPPNAAREEAAWRRRRIRAKAARPARRWPTSRRPWSSSTGASTAAGPTRAKTIYDGNVLTTVLADIFTTVEETLVERGRGDLVVAVRSAFQEAMRHEFVAVVEEQTAGASSRSRAASTSPTRSPPRVRLRLRLRASRCPSRAWGPARPALGGPRSRPAIPLPRGSRPAITSGGACLPAARGVAATGCQSLEDTRGSCATPVSESSCRGGLAGRDGRHGRPGAARRAVR